MPKLRVGFCPLRAAPTTQVLGLDLPILYQDEQLIAVHKPNGLLVHRSWIDPHETRFALQLVRDMIGQHVYPVHRLDRPTSGVLLFAKQAESAALVAEQIRLHQVRKHYLAVVRGYAPESGFIDHPLKPKFDKFADANRQEEQAEQDAQTQFQRLATVELPVSVDKYPSTRYSLMHLEPITGRKHQLRRHLKHLHHPIIGDPKYGKSSHNRFFAEHFGCSRLLLAAVRLELTHPMSGATLVINAPLAEDFFALVERLAGQEHLPSYCQTPI